MLTHGEWADCINDRNADGFQDNALSKDLVLRSEWQYTETAVCGGVHGNGGDAGKGVRAIAPVGRGTDGCGWPIRRRSCGRDGQDGLCLPGTRAQPGSIDGGEPRSDPVLCPYRSYMPTSNSPAEPVHQMKTTRDDLVVGLSPKVIAMTRRWCRTALFPCRGAVRRCAARRPRWGPLLSGRSSGSNGM